MIKMMKVCLWALALTPLVADNSIFVPANGSFFMRSFLVLTSVLFLIGFISSRKFRDEITQKVNLLIKNPIVISVFSFIFIFIISTITALDKYSAFWGNTVRVEGLVGMIYFLSIFIFSLLVFEKKDWLGFFKLSLAVSFIVLLKEFTQFSSGVNPNSFFGNTTFLSGYLLFSIFCSVIVFSEVKNKFWKYISIGIPILSILGIFIAQTRGTIAGLAVGFIVILIYGIVKGKNISYKKLNLRKISIILLCFLFVFSAVFIGTRKNEIWQKVPGLARVAIIGTTDATTQTRLLMGKLSLQSVNPKEEGMKKLLIGWGPENFSLAYGQYFNPKQFQYEMDWFDRSHNKLFDTLVMDGLLGLIAYLVIWFFFFKAIFKKRECSLLSMGLLFFGISLLVHLLFVFDQLITYISFFAVLSFSVYLTTLNIANKEIKKNKQKHEIELNMKEKAFIGIFFSILVLFLCFVYFRNDLPAYIQIREYDSLRKKNDAKIMLNEIDGVFDPFTTAQMKIRYDFLFFITKNYDAKSESIVKLSDTAFLRAEEYTNKVPFDLQFRSILAYNYNNQGKDFNNPEFIKKAEEHLRTLLLSAPNRPDFNYVLALNLFYQNRYDESFTLAEKLFDTNPEYFLQNNTGSAEWFYTLFIKHFYDVKDKDNFIRAAKRLKENNYAGSATLDQIINFIEKANSWPNINFGK